MKNVIGQKVVVVGGVAGGASVAARVRRLDEKAEVVMFERGPNVSFSNCCLPFHLNKLVPNADRLVLMHPKEFAGKYNIDARVNSEVVSIDRENKKVHVKNHATGEEYDESYDVLALAPGADAVRPRSIKGSDRENVFVVKNVVDVASLQAFIDTHDVKEMVVVGGGYIGLEVAETLTEGGIKVTIVEMQDQVMLSLDNDMAQTLHKELYDHGVTLLLESVAAEITEDKVILKDGREIPAKAVVMAVGVRPCTELAKQAGLEIGKTGGILVNQHYQTSDPSIYAVGDVIEVTNRLTREKTLLPLAGPAQRQARAAADHMYGIPHNNKGVIGSSCLHLFSLNVAVTGLNARACEARGIDYRVVYTMTADKVSLMPGSRPIFFKLIFEYPTGRILGAQAIGEGDSVKRVDVIATMIAMNGTLEDLKELELCYSPYYGTAKDVVNQAALVGLNVLYGKLKQAYVGDLRSLVESGACIIDVREKREWDMGHIKGAINIPMTEFRQRIDEFPKDRPVYLHCRSSQRSYNVIQALQALGYDNVYNITGSMLGFSNHEYFLDQTTGRESILTAYNFK